MGPATDKTVILIPFKHPLLIRQPLCSSIMFHKYPFQFLRHSCCWFVSHFPFSFIHYLSITKCIKIIHFGSQFAHSKTHTAKVCLLFQIIPNWKMSYKQQCGCRRHDELTEGLEFKTKKLAHRPYPKADVQNLISDNLLSERATYLCDVCAQFSKSEYGDKVKKLKSNHIESTINDIECGNIESSDLVNLATALGKSQYDTFKQEARETSRNYSETIHDFSPSSWLQNRNVVLLAFMNGIVGNEGNDLNKKQSVYIAAAIDCLMAAVVCNCITPLFFIFNLITYFFSGSKTTACILSALSPSGSYYTMKNWFKGQLRNICKLPSNDIITFFDNNQVLSRNWRVRFDAKVKLSVITSVLHIITKNANLLQTHIQLDPYCWLYHTQVQTENVIQRMLQFLKHCSTVFEKYRNHFVIERLNKVYKEQLTDGTDFIDKLVNDITIDIPRGNTNEDPYLFIEHNHPESPPEIKLGEPVLTNPCSYASVKEVLDSLLHTIVNNTDRKWTILGCDGLPYILASRLIDKDESLQHILLEPGLGHYEINMVKALFKLLWEVALSDLANLMGYKSIKAQVHCQNASDHHKSWQILQIFLYATADELILPYIRKCLSENLKPSLNNFYEWLKTVKNSNYLFMQEAIFTYVYSVFLFRAAVRRNNNEVLIAARTKFSSLFYGFNMTSYQEIDYRDLKMRLLAPPEIQNYISDNESFSQSGHESKGEGGDFVLENMNKRIKSLIPKGVPTEDVWLQACRSFETLDKVSNHCMTDRSKAVLLLWIFYVFVLSCVCYVFVRVCLYVLCGHLQGKG